MGKVCYMYVTYEMQILMPCVIECVYTEVGAAGVALGDIKGLERRILNL